MTNCEAELCPSWTGHGCICAVIGDRPTRVDDDYSEPEYEEYDEPLDDDLIVPSIVDSPTARRFRGVEIERSRVMVDYASHPVPISVVEHGCAVCRLQAAHKVGDESGPAGFHPLTTYLCCADLKRLGMNCDLYPWESARGDEPVPERCDPARGVHVTPHRGCVLR